MSYYYSYPYGPVPNPMDSYWRFQSGNSMGVPPMGVNPSAVEPPFPSGATITPQTPNEPGQTPPTPPQDIYYNPQNPSGFVNPFGNVLAGRIGGSYIENILRLNRGKMATVYMTFDTGQTAMNKSFTGVVEAAGKDHIILSDPNTGHRYVLLMVYVDYIEFPEEINYYYPIDNTLNIVDPDLLEKYPDIAYVYNYVKQQQEKEKQQQQQQMTPGDVTQQY